GDLALAEPSGGDRLGRGPRDRLHRHPVHREVAVRGGRRRRLADRGPRVRQRLRARRHPPGSHAPVRGDGCHPGRGLRLGNDRAARRNRRRHPVDPHLADQARLRGLRPRRDRVMRSLHYLAFMAGFPCSRWPLTTVRRGWLVPFPTVANDIGGYATGVLFGKHPIAPQISPKKSWEGFAGSVVLQCAVGAAAFVYLLDAPWWQGVLVGLIMTITATAGDFAESAVKRDLGVKDMGTFIPGHGGMMDRLDSLVPNAFTSWALFTVFLGSGIAG
ncbi:MAG: phosphatidate cytidylyltransferase, partial [Actinobacteria bacterium]|nr:phosphatidate cytidylyltransferase [Actinomycetota bacterium]